MPRTHMNNTRGMEIAITPNNDKTIEMIPSQKITMNDRKNTIISAVKSKISPTFLKCQTLVSVYYAILYHIFMISKIPFTSFRK